MKVVAGVDGGEEWRYGGERVRHSFFFFSVEGEREKGKGRKERETRK